MLIGEHWKRLPGDESNWAQALIRHKLELQQGLAETKKRLRRVSEEEAFVVDMKKFPSIVAQEPDLEDDRKLIEAFGGDARSSQQQDVEAGKISQTPSAASPQPQETSKDLNSSVSLSTLIELTLTPAADSLPPSIPTADTTQEFASLMKDLLEPGTNDKQPISARVEIELQVERESTIECTAVEQSTRIMNPNANMADEISITRSAASAMVESTERSSTEFTRGHKRCSDEAGLDEQATCDQLGPTEKDEKIKISPKKRKDTSDSKVSNITPPDPLPKTPARGNTLRGKQNANSASVRRSKRHL